MEDMERENLMANTYELFGPQAPSIVEKLPNSRIKESIVSDNYGMICGVREDNYLYKILTDKDNTKNVLYWHEKFTNNRMSYVDLIDYLVGMDPNRPRCAMHPQAYGVIMKSCPWIDCAICHMIAIDFLYRKYKESTIGGS